MKRFTLILTSFCFLSQVLAQGSNLERVLIGVLQSETLGRVLDLDKPEVRAGIRVVDIFQEDPDMRLMAYSPLSETPFLTYTTRTEQFDFNSGECRDLIIYNFRYLGEKRYSMNIVAPEFLFRNRIKNVYRFDFIVQTDSNESTIISERYERLECQKYRPKTLSAFKDTKEGRIMEQVFQFSEVRQLLELDSKTDKSPIRIIDTSGRLVKSMVRIANSEGLLYDIVHLGGIPFDYNTGCYRDIFIANFEEFEDGSFRIFFHTTAFDELKYRKTRYFGEVRIRLSESFEILSKEIKSWH